MVNPDSLSVGDFVVVTEEFKSFGKVGAIFRIVSSRVPKNPTLALGWKMDMESGTAHLSDVYILPHDKISLLPREEVAKLFDRHLESALQKVRAAEKEYLFLKNRRDGLLYFKSAQEEARTLLSKTFYGIE